jgi:hypothetical protein
MIMPLFSQGLIFMNRLGLRFSYVLLGSMLVGCGGGLDEGSPKELPKDTQSPELKSFMEKNRKNMTSLSKGKPKGAAAAAPATPTP